MKIKKNILSSSIAVILIATFVFGSVPQKAQAIIPVFDAVGKAMQAIATALQHVAILSTGLPGTGASVYGAVRAGQSPCDVSEKAFKVVNTVDTAIGVDVLAGDAGKLAKLSTKIATMQAINLCYSAVLDVVEHGGTIAGLSGEQALNAMSMSALELRSIINSYDQRIEMLLPQRSDAVTKLWEGVAYRLLATVQQTITNQLIGQLVQKYKISDFQKYAGAVATQLYTSDYVRANYPDKTDQLMMRSMLQNDLTKSELMPLVQQQAKDSLGFVPEELDVSSPDYYVKLAQAGNGQANPYFMQAVWQDRAQTAQSAGTVHAQQEISQGQGFIPARNCSQVIMQQNLVLDKTRQDLNRQLQIKQLAANKLQTQQVNNPSQVSATDVLAAQQAILDQRSQIANVANTADPFAKVCADIQNPAAAISNFTNSYLQSALNVANAPKPGNLPFFASFVESTASNFIKNLITGGPSNGSDINLLTEVGIKSANIASADVLANTQATAALKNSNTTAITQAGIFTGTPDATTPGQYTLSWDISGVPNASTVKITAAGGFALSIPGAAALKNQITVKAPAYTTFTLTVYNSSNVSQAVFTYAIPPQTTAGAVVIPSDGTAGDVTKLITPVETVVNASGVVPPDPTFTTTCGGNYTGYTQCLNATSDSSYCSAVCGGMVNGDYAAKSNELIRGNLPIRTR